MTMHNNTRPYEFLTPDERAAVKQALLDGKALYWHPVSLYTPDESDGFIPQVTPVPFRTAVYRLPRKPRELYVLYDDGRRLEVSTDPLTLSRKSGSLTVAKFVEVME